MNKVKTIAVWGVSILLALAMIAAGSFKLMGNEMMHVSFATLGLPSWFGYFIGVAEVAGGIGLLIPRTAALAALGLISIMLGAAYYHLAHTPIAEAFPALVFIALLSVVVVSRKGSAIWFPLKRTS